MTIVFRVFDAKKLVLIAIKGYNYKEARNAGERLQSNLIFMEHTFYNNAYFQLQNFY
ncbi:MAG: hypothetical protein ACYSWS_06660 [Planctomycetota bacterium]|jgi:hypothetical protein